jgi:predicted porin
MQKKIIALAIAGLSVSAFAQSNVQVYGTFDVSMFNQQADGAKSKNVMGNVNPTNWGLTGAEDLGGGLKAVFRLEGGFAPTTGALSQSNAANPLGTTQTERLFGRQAYLGLAGDFGTAIAGRLQTPGRTFIVKNGMSASLIDPVSALQQANGHLNSPVGLDAIGGTNTIGPRLDNAIAYVTPTFKGLTAVVAHSFYQQDTSTAGLATAVNANTEAFNYNNGPWDADIIFTTVTSKANGAANLISGVQENQYGLTYDFGVLKLTGTYTTHKLDIAGADGTDKLYSLLAKIPVSAAGSVELSYGKLTKDGQDSLNQLGNVLGTTKTPTVGATGFATQAALNAGLAAASSDASGWGALYRHNLSKRTWVYASYSRLNNDGNKAAALQLAPVNAGGSSSTTAIGMSHSF